MKQSTDLLAGNIVAPLEELFDVKHVDEAPGTRRDDDDGFLSFAGYFNAEQSMTSYFRIDWLARSRSWLLRFLSVNGLTNLRDLTTTCGTGATLD